MRQTHRYEGRTWLGTDLSTRATPGDPWVDGWKLRYDYDDGLPIRYRVTEPAGSAVDPVVQAVDVVCP
jgi:hypothetical protein